MPNYKILIVDDDPDDREIMDEAFMMEGSTSHLVLSSAQEVFTYLEGVTKDEDLPGLIMTDLNMPEVTGFELLQALKGMDRYRQIDVVVCSTSSLEMHINKCLEAGAREFITKPSELREYQKLAAHINRKVACLTVS